MLYNVKKIEYLDSTQVRVYGRPVQLKTRVKVKEPASPLKSNYKKAPEAPRTEKQIQHSLHTSVNRTVNQIYAISRSNKWEYFVTLTIDPKKLDNTNFNLISEKLNIWTNNIKKRYAPDLKYLLVPELHKDKSKWHFHGLFSNIDSLPLEFSGKVCVSKFVYDYVRKPYATKIYKNQKCLTQILNRLERKLSAPVFRETFKTITCDNGCEFTDMQSIEKSIYNKVMKRTKVYYCHPYNASERGSNENANKLIRRWVPKGSHISEFTDQYINELQDWINNYPRKIFNYLSANEYKALVA